MARQGYNGNKSGNDGKTMEEHQPSITKARPSKKKMRQNYLITDGGEIGSFQPYLYFLQNKDVRGWFEK